VESLNASTREAVVLGQRVQLNAQQFARIRAVVRHDSAFGYQPYIEISGTDSRAGAILAKSIQRASVPYVAGATPVALRGFVSKAADSRGRLTVGELKVDATAATSNLNVGDLIELAGTQPNARGLAIATTLRVVQGIIGSGTDGIIGSGTNGIIGSGTNGIIGSGTDGIIGSGTNGIIGSGTNGIIGSGTDGIIGSGTNGIIGSGTNGIIGSGTDGIIGSGTDGIIGSGTDGIIGSGTNGIIGSGTN